MMYDNNTLRSTQQQQLQQYQYAQQQNFLTSGGGYLGQQGGYSYTFPNTITITPVPVPQETYDAKSAVQIVYRFGQGFVSSCLIKGTNDAVTAKNVFLGQFTDTPEPEIIAAVLVLLA